MAGLKKQEINQKIKKNQRVWFFWLFDNLLPKKLFSNPQTPTSQPTATQPIGTIEAPVTELKKRFFLITDINQ